MRALDIKERRITTVLWANGSRGGFSWIDALVFASGRQPMHTRGTTDVPGLYFLGLPWLHKWKSAFLFGVGEDAEHLARKPLPRPTRPLPCAAAPPFRRPTWDCACA
jgi:putative flavoprotein involved in K+ transport